MATVGSPVVVVHALQARSGAGPRRRWARPRRVGVGRPAWCRRGSGRRRGRRPAAGSGGPRLGGEDPGRSSPTIRPVTPTLPPKNRFSTAMTRTSTSTSADQRAEDRAPRLAGEHARGASAGTERRDRPAGRWSVPADHPVTDDAERGGSSGRRPRAAAGSPSAGVLAVDPGEEAGLGTVASPSLWPGAPARRCRPCPRRPRAWRTPRRPWPPGRAARRGGSTRRRRHQAPAEHVQEGLLPALTRSPTGAASSWVWGLIRGSVLNWLTPRGTTASIELRVAVEHPGEGVVSSWPSLRPRQTTTWPWTSTPGRAGPAATGGCGAPPVAQACGPDLGIGGVDRDVQRAEPLGPTRSRSDSVKRVRVVKFP